MEEKQRNSRRSDQEWIALIQECRTSGLGDREWCELHGIPISTFYTKITKLRRKACDIPKAHHRVIREAQQVVPLSIIDEKPDMYMQDEISIPGEKSPAVVLRINGYCMEISNSAARDTIMNTLSVLQQLC